MILSTIYLVLLGVTAVLSFPALWQAKRLGALSLAVCALPVVPVGLFFAGLTLLNSEAEVGYASIVYPLIVVGVSLAVLYFGVFILASRREARQGMFLLLFALTSLTGFIAGAVVPPWYD